MNPTYHLSVVVSSRNDNHGENLLYRMQHFVSGFLEQCKRHSLPAELIIVEWNPPAETPPLQEVLKFPEDMGPCAVRIISVPQHLHAQFKHANHLPLFQMIAKNVGIKRSSGKFVLATNIDILFSDALVCFMRDQLEAGRLYRVDRLDVPSQLPQTESLDEILEFCRDRYFRVNRRGGTCDRSLGVNAFTWKGWKKLNEMMRKPQINRTQQMHTNACGDYTLLAYEDWERLRGYPEWEMFSWHIDSVLLYQAQRHQVAEVNLPITMPIYHIEHSPGSGYSPEGQNLLFDRLSQLGIPYLNNGDFTTIIEQMNNQLEPVVYNQDHWGLSLLSLEETIIRGDSL